MDNFIYKLKNTNISTIPFDYCVVDNIFSDKYYYYLSNEIENLDLSLFKVNHFARGGKFRNLIKIIRNKKSYKEDYNYKILLKNNYKYIVQFIDFFFEKEDEILSILYDKIKTDRLTDDRYLYFSIVKDEKSYYIEPHPDSDQNIYTILIYTPTNHKNQKFGLELYEKKEENFIVKKKINFNPNQLLFFAPSKNTFHGVKKLNEKLYKTRNSFQIFFMKRDS